MGITNSDLNITLSLMAFIEATISATLPSFHAEAVNLSAVLQHELDALDRYGYYYIQIQNADPAQQTLLTFHTISRDVAESRSTSIWFKGIMTLLKDTFLHGRIPLYDYEALIDDDDFTTFLETATVATLRTYLANTPSAVVHQNQNILFFVTDISAVETVKMEKSLTKILTISLQHYAPANLATNIS
jgi:hypothetical protein